MKMSDVFELPLQRAVNELAVIDKNDGVVGWADAFVGETARDCFVEAVNNHEKLVELLEYFYKQPVDLMQVWPAGHIAKQNEAISLLKELGHEI